AARNGWRKESGTRMNAAQSVHQRLVRHPFDEIAKRTRCERLMDVLISLIRRQDYTFGLGITLADLAQSFQAAHSRQSQIHKDNVRRVQLEQPHCFFAST